MKCLYFFREITVINIFLLILTPTIIFSIVSSVSCDQNNFTFDTLNHKTEIKKSETPDEKTLLNSNLLILSSVNGDLIGLDLKDGRELWTIKGPPLISQSISHMEFTRDGHTFRIVPSLEGSLYMLETSGTGGMRALPVNADTLFTSAFQLSNDALLVGGRDHRIYAFDPLTGQVRYNCTRDGCQHSQFSAPSKGPVLLSRRLGHTVRAIDLHTGQERWNFSVGQDVIVPLQDANFTEEPATEKEKAQGDAEWKIEVDRDDEPDSKENYHEVDLTFNVENGIVIATTVRPFFSLLWTHKLAASLSKVWSLKNGKLKDIPLFSADERAQKIIEHQQNNGQYHTVTDMIPAPQLGLGCHSKRMIYLGDYRGQLYIQLEDGSNAQAPTPSWVALPPAEEGTTNPDSPNNPMRGKKASKSTSLAVKSPEPPKGYYYSTYEVAPSGLPPPPWEEGDSYFVLEDQMTPNPSAWWFQSILLGSLVAIIFHLCIRKKCTREESRVQGVAVVVHYESPAPPGPAELDAPALSVPSQPSLPGAGSSSASLTMLFESRYASEYTHICCLGKGGFGVVFEAEHNLDNCRYAIKRVRVKNSPLCRERLLREVKALALLEHPGIVRYYMAWIETPPDGWQESRDTELLRRVTREDALSLETGDDDESGTTDRAKLVRERGRSPGVNNLDNAVWVSGDPETETSSSVLNCNRVEEPSFSESWDDHRLGNKAAGDCSVDIIFANEDSEELSLEGDTSTSHVGSLNAVPAVRKTVHRNNSVEIVFERSTAGRSSSTKGTSPEQQVANQQSTHSLEDSGSRDCDRVAAEQGPSRLYLYIQMQLCQRDSLKGWLSRHSGAARPSQTTLFDMFVQIADAVGYLHENGLMHRDLKPSNILFDLNGRIRIVDFGLVTSLMDEEVKGGPSDESSSRSSSESGYTGTDGELVHKRSRHRHTDRVGTTLYMSPEQSRGEKYDHKVDIFSMGLIFLELMFSFSTEMERISSLLNFKNHKLPQDFLDTYPEEGKFALWLLSEKADDRPSCDDILSCSLLIGEVDRIRKRRVRTISGGARHNRTSETERS